jgi:hypothetical protein
VSRITSNRASRTSVARVALALTGVLLGLALAACQRARRGDTQPLDNSGMTYDSVKQLDALDVTSAEIAEILKVHEAGFRDDDCVRIVRISRARGQPFNAGSAVAGLIQAGMDDQTILDLASLNQLGPTSGEFEAMHLAGLSNAIILAVARHRAEDKPVLSGATLAGLKNAGLRGSTLLELARRGVPDSEAKAIISYRRRGASDSQILRRFSGS